jgi:dTDP-4-amino-4,6-dideoxygalactose transaminase
MRKSGVQNEFANGCTVVSHTQNAREAIALFMRNHLSAQGARIMVPAYFGYSPREGSGVIDPLISVSAEVILYRVTRDLQVDVQDFKDKLAMTSPDVVLLIHYFGWPDRNVEQLCRLAREEGALVLEDEAHSLLSHFIGGATGLLGDASAISVHKSLPMLGGLLIEKHSHCRQNCKDREARIAVTASPAIARFDLAGIARLHIANAKKILDLIADTPAPMRPLWTEIPDGVVPLSLAVLVPPALRQHVYESMNAAEYPVVCLYYRLGPGIDKVCYPESWWLSERLVNLPLGILPSAQSQVGMVRTLEKVLLDAEL